MTKTFCWCVRLDENAKRFSSITLMWYLESNARVDGLLKESPVKKVCILIQN
jgi:hypothetical protein